MVGPKSEAAQKAYKAYVQQIGNGDEEENLYGFFHYEWHEGNPAYDAAYKAYSEKSAMLSKQFTKQCVDIGRTVAGSYADQKVQYESDFVRTYSEFGAQEAERLARFGWERYK